MIEDYDIIMIGSGIAGKVLSWTLASRGKRVAVVERKYVGGSCPNSACLPSKNVVHSAKIATYLREFGGRIDMTTVRGRKRKMVDGLVAAHLQKYHYNVNTMPLQHSRDDKTAIELFLSGVRSLALRSSIVDVVRIASRISTATC